MVSPLDAIREQAGIQAGIAAPEPIRRHPPAPAPGASGWPASPRPASEGFRGTARHGRTRVLLGGTAALDIAVALVHARLAAALAHGHGLLMVAHNVLAWPLPLAQQVLVITAAAVLGVVAVPTRGWRWLNRWDRRALLAAVVASVFGAGPTLLLCLLAAVALLLVAVGVIVILTGLVAVVVRSS